MDFFSVLSMIGGLALFLYGMKIMGDALSKTAGGKLESILENMTNSPLKGVLLGAGVTAVIQSSSATTVMVVGFVNSGIMKLRQAVGVIMGANIGTTVTSWILSMAGIESDNILIKMLKPTSFSPIFAAIGIILIMAAKSEKKKDIGTILLGFAILMFGMDTMSAAVKPLADVPEFTSLFTAFQNPILGMLVGALLTAVIQSSSASVGILQAMCVTGSVTVGAALPVIMGQNIGTCITALISSIGTKKNARRASLVHLYFNLIGTVLFMVAFYGINEFVHFAFISDTATGATIAIIHSVFNIAATIVLLPMAKFIERLAYITIPLTEDEDMTEIQVLDDRFLERPSFAVAQCKSAVCDMSKMVEEAINLCGQLSEKYNQTYVDKIIEIEELVDKREDEISIYLTKLMTKDLSEKDSKLVNEYSKAIVDFERISDYAKGIAYAEKKMNKDKENFSAEAARHMKVIVEATVEIVENTVASFIHNDRETALRIDPLSDVISSLKHQIRKEHNVRLAAGKCSIEQGMSLNDMANSLGRIAKHCSNIAEEEIATATDEYDLHNVIRTMKESNEFYKECVNEYNEKYSI